MALAICRRTFIGPSVRSSATPEESGLYERDRPDLRCQEDINIFWMGHKPKTTSEIYSHLFEEIDMRLAEAEAAGFGFDLPKNPFEKAVVAPIAPRFKTEVFQEVAVSA